MLFIRQNWQTGLELGSPHLEHERRLGSSTLMRGCILSRKLLSIWNLMLGCSSSSRSSTLLYSKLEAPLE
jgi:hypothetical protein